MEHPQGHDEIQLTYYAGDGVLGDDTDAPIDDVDLLVGTMNLSMFGASDPDDPHILLVRNEQRKLDIEVTFSDGKFAHEVLGFNHSDEPERRRRPRWDDD
jgi:agmatine/peptidylarginine deiminase